MALDAVMNIPLQNPTGEKRDGGEERRGREDLHAYSRLSPAFTPLPQPLHLFPSLYTSSPAFTPLYQAFTPLYPAFTPLCMSLHVHIKDCEVLLSK